MYIGLKIWTSSNRTGKLRKNKNLQNHEDPQNAPALAEAIVYKDLYICMISSKFPGILPGHLGDYKHAFPRPSKKCVLCHAGLKRLTYSFPLQFHVWALSLERLDLKVCMPFEQSQDPPKMVENGWTNQIQPFSCTEALSLRTPENG